jgi:hypothetical protein
MLPANEELIQRFQNLASELQEEKQERRRAAITRTIKEVLENPRVEHNITLQNNNIIRLIKVFWDVPEACFQ